MRLTVDDVLGYLDAGMSVRELLADFPELTGEDVEACIAWRASRED